MKLILLSIVSSLLLVGSSAELAEARQKFAAHQYKECVRTYRAALKKYPDRAAEISYNIGLCYLALDSTTKAAQYFQRAVSQDNAPVTSRAYTHIAVLLAREDKAPAALRTLKKALMLDPTNEEARYNYEILLRKQQADQPNPDKQPPPPNNNQPPAHPRPKREAGGIHGACRSGIAPDDGP